MLILHLNVCVGEKTFYMYNKCIYIQLHCYRKTLGHAMLSSDLENVFRLNK